MTLGNVDLTPQLVQAVRDAVDIVDVASEHTRLTKAGKRHQGLCPLHKEKTPSFSVDPTQGLFYCFGCGVGGDAIKLHQLLTGDDFPAAIESLARRYGIPMPSRSRRRQERQGPDVAGALDAAEEFFRDQLQRHPGPRRYLEERRIPPELVERFRLGYAPDSWEALLQELRPRVSLEALEAAGLVGRRKSDRKPYDRFRHRLMFPVHSVGGRLVGFGGRALGDDKAKYINTAETERFHKSRLLYGLHLAKRAMRESRRAVLVEGYFDVIGTVAAGEEAAVASMGTSLTTEQARLLKRFAEEVVLAYDGDDAGETAFRRSLPLLLKENLGVYRARFGEGHDPDSLRLEAGAEAVLEALHQAQDGVLLEIERLVPATGDRPPQEQARQARQVVELLQPVPDPVARFAYGRRAAERLGVPPEMIQRRLRNSSPRQGGPPPPDDPGGPPTHGPSERTAPRSKLQSAGEQAILELLLAEGSKIPPLEDLPPPEAFLDERCRNIYRLFCDLYGGEEQDPPNPKILLDAAAADDTLLAALAEILMGGSIASQPKESRQSGLPELLQQMERRWRAQRLRELQQEIIQAQRGEDPERLQALLEEKTALSRRHHPLR